MWVNKLGCMTEALDSKTFTVKMWFSFVLYSLVHMIQVGLCHFASIKLLLMLQTCFFFINGICSVSGKCLCRERVCEYFSVNVAIPLQQKHGLRWIFFSWCISFHTSVFTQVVMLTKGLAPWHAVPFLPESVFMELGLVKGREKMLYRGIELLS